MDLPFASLPSSLHCTNQLSLTKSLFSLIPALLLCYPPFLGFNLQGDLHATEVFHIVQMSCDPNCRTEGICSWVIVLLLSLWVLNSANAVMPLLLLLTTFSPKQNGNIWHVKNVKINFAQPTYNYAIYQLILSLNQYATFTQMPLGCEK